VRERRKEPREGSEIDPETVCVQTVRVPALMALSSNFVSRYAQGAKDRGVKVRLLNQERAIRAGMMAYLLYNGSATYIQ
jgi:hypothetical protein